MNPKSTDIFGRLSWLTKSFKNLCCRLGILEQTVAECCEGGGGGGGTNPTDMFLPYNNAGTFADSYLKQDGDILKSVYGGNDIGINLDFANGTYYFGDPITGDYILFFNGLSGSQDFGIFSNNKMYYHANGLTDSGYLGTTTARLYFDTTSFKLSDDSISTDNGFKVTYGVGGVIQIDAVSLGDYSNLSNGTSLTIDDANEIIKTSYGGNDIGLKLDFANSQYKLGDARGFYTDGGNTKIGDYDNLNGGTKLTIDDGNVVIELRSELPSKWENISSSVVSQVKTAYGANNLDLTTSGYTVYVPGVYTVRFASTINVIDLPDPTIYIGQTIVLVNKDNNDNQEIGANQPYDNLLGTVNPTLGAAVTWTLHSDGQDWNITSVY